MIKRFKLLFIGLMFILFILSACTENSADAEEEIKEISQDIILINDDIQLEFEDKMGALGQGDIHESAYKDFLKETFIPQMKETKEFLASYKEPTSELAKRYYDVAHPYITVSTNILLTLGKEQLEGVEGNMSQEMADEYDAELQTMAEEYGTLREELIEVEETIEKEEGISFVELD